MDAEFMRRLRAGRPPFDGVALRAGDPTPLTALQAALRSMAVYLHDQSQQEPLFAVREEYDPEGVSFVAEGTTWDNLLQIVSSAASLHEVGRDHNVLFAAFFPQSREFYLRIYVPEEDRQPDSAEWVGGFRPHRLEGTDRPSGGDHPRDRGCRPSPGTRQAVP
jgi:hypothetical protein